MQVFDLTLAAHPFRNNVVPWVGQSLAFVLLAGFTWWNVATWLEHRAKLRDLRGEVTSFESQQRELESRDNRALQGIRRFDLGALALQADKANEVIEWKAFSWTRLFNLLERVMPGGVRMSSVRPLFSSEASGSRDMAFGDATRQVLVAVEGTARTFDDLTDLEADLQSDPHFGRVEPERITRGPGGEIVFQLRFHYFPEAADGEEPEAPEPAPVATAAARAESDEGLP